jgi:hypothetical protein
MTAHRDPDRLIHAFLMEGQTELADPVFDAVRATIERSQQRVVVGPWRMPLMNKFVSLGLGAAAVVVALVAGTRLLGFPDAGGVGGSPTPVGGTVEYQLDGGPATTVVDAVADGTSVSGAAVTTFVGGTHTVQLECGARGGDVWVVGGTVESTTVRGERAGGWSAVIVKEGSPQQVGIWLSIEPEGFCEGLTSADFSDIGPENFNPVESGALVPPPDLAP